MKTIDDVLNFLRKRLDKDKETRKYLEKSSSSSALKMYQQRITVYMEIIREIERKYDKS